MKLCDKFMDNVQDLSKVKNPTVSKERSNNYLQLSKKNVLGNTMLYIDYTLL